MDEGYDQGLIGRGFEWKQCCYRRPAKDGKIGVADFRALVELAMSTIPDTALLSSLIIKSNQKYLTAPEVGIKGADGVYDIILYIYWKGQ